MIIMPTNASTSEIKGDRQSLPLPALPATLASSPDALSHAEAQRRLVQYGYNEIAEQHTNPGRTFLTYFWGPIPWMIEAAAVLGVLLSSLLLVSSPSTAQAGEPLEKVRETVDAVLAVLRDKSLQGPEHAEQRREKMRQVVFQRFSFAAMAQQVLGPHWHRRTPAEKQEFITLFSELLERSYINKIESYTGEQKVLYTKETIDKDGYASVRTEIIIKRDANVEVEYRLLRREGNWQVYDVVIEGVSLVNNYRTQFNNIVSQESFDALMKKLKLKLEQERVASPIKE